MKQIQKKLNLVDYLIFIIILFSILVYFLLFKRQKETVIVDIFTPSPTWSSSEFQPKPYWQTNALTSGLELYNSLGQLIATINQISRIPTKQGSQEFYYISMKVEAYYNKNTHTYTFNNKPLLVGNNLEIESGKTLLTGQVVGIYKNNDEKKTLSKQKKAIVTVKFRDQDPWVAEQFIKIDLKDNAQQPIIKTVKAFISPAEKSEGNWQGQLVKTTDPLKKDVLVTFELHHITCTDTNCFYNTYFPLSVGTLFPVDFVTFEPGIDSSVMAIQYDDP